MLSYASQGVGMMGSAVLDIKVDSSSSKNG